MKRVQILLLVACQLFLSATSLYAFTEWDGFPVVQEDPADKRKITASLKATVCADHNNIRNMFKVAFFQGNIKNYIHPQAVKRSDLVLWAPNTLNLELGIKSVFSKYDRRAHIQFTFTEEPEKYAFSFRKICIAGKDPIFCETEPVDSKIFRTFNASLTLVPEAENRSTLEYSFEVDDNNKAINNAIKVFMYREILNNMAEEMEKINPMGKRQCPRKG